MNKYDVLKKIAKNIQIARKSKGYTQERFAEKMNVSWSYISKLETGTQNLSIGKIFEISKCLNIDINELLDI